MRMAVALWWVDGEADTEWLLVPGRQCEKVRDLSVIDKIKSVV